MNFKDLTRFVMRRSPAEAVWFYAAYAVLGYIITIGIALIILPYLDVGTMRDDVLSQKVGRSVAVILSSGLTLLIVLAKNYHMHVVYLALILCTAILGAWGGLFLGLIIPAVLTMLRLAGEAVPEQDSLKDVPPPAVPLARVISEPVKKAETRRPNEPVAREERKEAEPKQATLMEAKMQKAVKTVEEPAAAGPIKYSAHKKESAQREQKAEPKKEPALAFKPKSEHNPLFTIETAPKPSLETIRPPMVTESAVEPASKKRNSPKKAA